MTDILTELRRSPDPADAEVARLLSALRTAAGGQPRANDALAAFLAAQDAPHAATAGPVDGGEPELAVVVGPRTAARRRRLWLLPGVTVAHLALAGAAALAAVAVAVGTAPSDDVVVRPEPMASTSATNSPSTPTDATGRGGVEPTGHPTRLPSTAGTATSSTGAAAHRRHTAGSGPAGSSTGEARRDDAGRDDGDRTRSGTDDASDDATDDPVDATDDPADDGPDATAAPVGPAGDGSADDSTAGAGTDAPDGAPRSGSDG